MIEIIKYCKNNNECIKTLNNFIHISFNNIKLITLNTYPKRIYKYDIRNVYPTENYTELNDSSIKKIFKLYCYDVNIRKPMTHVSSDSVKNLLNPFIDVDISLNMCDENIVPNDNNFRKLIKELHIQSALPNIKKKKYVNTSEDRYIKYYNESPSLLENDILNELNDLLLHHKLDADKILSKEEINKYNTNKDKIISDLMNDRDNKIDELSEYFTKTDKIDKDHKNIINIDIVNKLLKNIVNGKTPKLYYNYIKSIQRIISRIKNQRNKNTIFKNNISNTMNITDNGINTLKEYLKSREFLLHDYVFINKESEFKGFYEYIKDDNNDNLYQSYDNIYNIVKSYTNLLDNICGVSNELFDKQLELNLLKYILILIIYDIYNYINQSFDNDPQGNIMFNLLEKKLMDDKKKNNHILSTLLFDLIVNIIQEHKDSEWINILYNKDELAKKISREREIEKQSLLNKKKNKSSIDKYIEDQMNAIGVSNMWIEAKQDIEKYVKTDKYDMDIIQQRKEADALKGINSNSVGKSEDDHVGYTIPGDDDD